MKKLLILLCLVGFLYGFNNGCGRTETKWEEIESIDPNTENIFDFKSKQ